MLNVTVWPLGSTKEDEGIEFENIDFLSLINNDTYGKPPLITAEAGSERAMARDGATVLYLNPATIAAVEVEKLD